MSKLLFVVGIVTIFLIVWLFSEDRKNFPFRIVIWGFILQFSFGLFVLKVPIGVRAFEWIGNQVTTFLNYSLKGADFLFGNALSPAQSGVFGFQFAIIVFCTIIFFSAFVSLLYYYGIMQKIVYWIAWVMEKTMKTSGIESLSASSNIFLGQTEAPLLIRNYLKYASRSEINTIMVGGFATIAGGVMAAYISIGIRAEYLITASLLSAPGGLMLSKVLIPPSKDIKTLEELKQLEIPVAKTPLLAFTNGASDGVKLAVNIMAMLVAFIALIALLDGGLGLVHYGLKEIGFAGFPSTLKELLGYVFMPFAYLVGIPANEAQIFGGLLGTKLALNEFIAYVDLGQLIKSGAISERTAILSSFALCGFANFSSIAIQIGGLGALCPEKKEEIASLGFKAMIVGALTNLLTATIAGIIL